MRRLARGYRRLMGGRQSALQLYLGFTAFFAGFALGLIGILLALSGDLLISGIWQRRGLGITLAAIGFPLFLMGLQMTLPSRFIIHAAAGAGAVVCLAGVVLFNQAWPYEWNQGDADRSGQVIGVYALGLVLLFTTTALALIMNFVSRIMAMASREDPYDIFVDPTREVTMEEVLRDIEREVARQKLTWGGMEEDRLPREFVKLSAGFGPGAMVSKGKVGTVTKTNASDLQIAFDSLARLRGVEGREVAGEDDTKTAIEALRALRRARQAELEASWWYRLRRSIVALFTGRNGTTRPTLAAPETGMAIATPVTRTPEAGGPGNTAVAGGAPARARNGQAEANGRIVVQARPKPSPSPRPDRNYPKIERESSTSRGPPRPPKRPIGVKRT